MTLSQKDRADHRALALPWTTTGHAVPTGIGPMKQTKASLPQKVGQNERDDDLREQASY